MNRRTLSRAATVASLALVAVIILAATGPVAAQSDPAPPATSTPSLAPGGTVNGTTTTTDPASVRADDQQLRITAVSPWVDPTGVFQVRFTPAPGVPLDSKVTWTVHQRLVASRSATLRQQVDKALDRGASGRVLQAPVTRSLAELGDANAGLSIDIPLRSTRATPDGLYLSEAGPYPVEIVLLSPDGPELWRHTVLLNRLPQPTDATSASGDPLRLHATLLLPVDSGPALTVNGRGAFEPTTRSQLVGVDRLLEQRTDTPFALAARANTLSGLERSDETWARALFDRLSRSGSSSRPLLLPYVQVATGGLVAEDAADQLTTQIELGRRVVADFTGQTVETSTWVLDDYLTEQSLPTLKSRGVTAVVTNPDRVKVAGTDRLTLRNTSLPLDGGDGIRVMVSDPDMGLRLAVSGATPAVRAHDVVSELMAAWFTVASLPEGQRQDPATVIPIDPATEPDVLDSLVPALTAGGPVATDPSRAMVPPLEENRNGTASLVPVSSPDQGAAVLRSIGTGQLLTGYRSMFGDNDPDLGLWSQLNAQSLSVELAGPARSDLHTSIANDIEQKVRRIQTPPSRTVVLTSRNSTVPLRFRNGLPYPARVRLRIRAPRIEVKGGRTRIVTLQPGNNRIDLDVTSRAPGQSLLRIETTSPDGQIDVASTAIPVRSSTISGVGAAIGAVALLFLLAWWISSARRSHRHEAKATGHHPTRGDGPGEPADPDADPDASPAEADDTGTVTDSG